MTRIEPLREQHCSLGPPRVGRLWTLFAVTTALVLVASACGSTTSGDDTVEPDPDSGTGDEPIGGPFPVADLTIRFTNPDADVDLTYRVSCLGDTATVTGDDVAVSPERACETLADPEAVDRLVNGAPPDQICTEQYGGADIAQITGTIDEQSVDTTVDRTNGCGIFDWDMLLAGLLPSPVGATG